MKENEASRWVSAQRLATLMIRDVATWQGDAGYESDNCLYDDNTVYAYVEYYVTAGRVANG